MTDFIFVLNLKTYERSFSMLSSLLDAVRVVKEESGHRIVVAPPLACLSEATRMYKDIFSQSADPLDYGAHTGGTPIRALSDLGVKGLIINHSEHRVSEDTVKRLVDMATSFGIESIVCAESPEEVKTFSEFNPTYIAIEPPELIGTGISVSSAKPNVITDSLSVLSSTRIKLLCGAGVSSADDVKRVRTLGAKGVLLASAFVKSKDPVIFLRQLLRGGL